MFETQPSYIWCAQNVKVMKKSLLTLSALFLAGISFSQVIMSENFDASTNLPAGWAQYNVDGLTPAANVNYMATNAWMARPNTVSGTGNMMVSTSWYTPAGTSNDWLVTPAINVPGTGSYTAQFDVMAPDAAYPDGYKVYISTTGNAVANFTNPAVLTVAAAPQTFTAQSIDLSTYAGQTIYIAIQNNSNDMFLLFVDNFVVRQPAANDAILESATLNRYSAVSTNNTLSLSVKNDGNNPITSLDINWNDGTAHTATVACNIAVGATATVNHPTAINYATAVEENIAISIDQVNASADPNTGNNSTSKLFNTVSQIANKKVVVEEGTGTWCGWCPRGAVAMDAMAVAHPDDFIGIAVHNGDPMTVTAYDNGANFSGFPGCNVDRAELDQGVSTAAFEGYYQARINNVVPAAISATSSGSGSSLTVDVDATFYTVFAAANYTLAVVLVEDNVTGTASGYNQTNYYAGGAQGAMGGYESLPNPVPAAQMVYNHVGRALLGGYTGQAGSVPATITDGQTASYSFTYTIPGTSNRANMHAVAMLIDGATGEIVNADEISIATVGLAEASTIAMNVYPNPATTEASVSFEGKGGEYVVSIIDMTGRVYATQTVSDAVGAQTVNLATSGLKAGTYMVNVANGSGSYTQNLIIK